MRLGCVSIKKVIHDRVPVSCGETATGVASCPPQPVMLNTIYVARHAHRMANDELKLSSIPRDPMLTARGEEQKHEFAAFFDSMSCEERPQLVICSPYTRCIKTALPLVKSLGLELCVEPGLAEWFAPVWPTHTGKHPSPRAAEHVAPHFPAVSLRWTPLLYPNPDGESIPALHMRMRECVRRIDDRCTAWGIDRVLLVSHAASAIALGRMLQTQGTFEDVCDKPIHAATASLSKYVCKRDASRNAADQVWSQEYNGATWFLKNGAEREWNFTFVPDNTTEPGMGPMWIDPYAPDPSLVYRTKL